ncbi:hypothetical protein NST69_20885 [Paenibacillus sp. FSL P2-0089]|uniref:CdiA C-terminal domain-containing protein n=1 Tax=Paenibacillus sp. FSL P2-0089 TaxID=2954526 RepID=UPI00315AEEDF
MASTKLVFNEDEVRRLQTKIGQVSQDTNRLYLQLKGQSSGWGGIPMGDHMIKAQVLINELTVEAEKLEDIIRVALRGVSDLQEENKRQADKLTRQFNLLLAAFGSLGLQSATGRVSIPEFVQRSATNLITSIAALSGKDELSRDPVVQQLRNVIQTSGLLTVESIAAQSKLNDIFAARNQIAKAQMAFKVYQAFGNQAQMEAVHTKAEEARQKLASLGVAKIYYEAGKELSAHYRQPAVTACEYDPSITADKVPLLHNEEYLLLLRLAMEKTAAGAYARSQLAAKRQEIQIAAALKQVQEQIEAERRLNGPPLTLPDGTPITADNKENETTWDFYQAKVYVPNEYLTPMYTSYLGWLDNTYGLTKWESKVRQSGDVVLAFTEGLVKEVVMGVADTATFAFKLVVDPVKTTTEMKNQAKYLIDHPEVLVEAAKMTYHQFDEGTPEEKAKMLGSVASILVPGLQVTKAGKVGKVLGEVEEAVTQAAKEALQGIRQKLPTMSPLGQTPEGFVFKIGEIPDTSALPKTPVQQRYMDGLEGGARKVKLTEPSLPAGGKPKGNYTKGDSHGLKKEHETADNFAEQGYDIEILDEVNGGNGYGVKESSNPDYLIEGEVFDCYAPTMDTNVDNILRNIRTKTKSQAERIVLNLDGFTSEKITEITGKIIRKANPNGDLKNLQELLIIVDGKITRIYGG